MKTIKDVKEFWENNPLFSGESKFKLGTKDFFEDHRRVYMDDVFAGDFPKELFIPKDLARNLRVLDLGCGVGFWTVELLIQGEFQELYAADLTQSAIDLTKKRLNFYGLKANLSIQNAEKMTYEDAYFDHVNCQGVIHHTPDTKATIREIARVLKTGGTAYISVYYRNIFLKLWPKISFIRKILNKLGIKLKGRGRESILTCSDPDEITRLCDGDKNPIGKSYTEDQIVGMLRPYFEVEKTFFNFFPARVFPFKIPKFIHRILSRNFGFLIHLNLRKK